MQPSTLYRYALSLSPAAALLAGCGGSQPPIGASGAMPQLRVGTPHAEVVPISGGALRSSVA